MGAIWYGGYRVISGGLTPGEFFSFTAAVILPSTAPCDSSGG